MGPSPPLPPLNGTGPPWPWNWGQVLMRLMRQQQHQIRHQQYQMHRPPAAMASMSCSIQRPPPASAPPLRSGPDRASALRSLHASLGELQVGRVKGGRGAQGVEGLLQARRLWRREVQAKPCEAG